MDEKIGGRLMSLRRSIVAVALTALLVITLPVVPAESQTALPKGVGQSATPPKPDKSFREHMVIVGSPTLQRMLTEKVLDEMYRTYKLAPAKTESTGTGAGLKLFCAGVGAEFPDIVAASRRMYKSEYETCKEHGVINIVEVQVGLRAVMVVTRKGDPVFNITPRIFYRGLAKEVPKKMVFETNKLKTWRDVDSKAPAAGISVILPDKDSGTRGFFDDYFLQAGCRHYPGINTIYAAVDRVPRCITLRGAPQVIEIAEPYVEKLMEGFAKAPRGTLAVVGELAYLRHKDHLELLPVSGVLPTTKNVENYDYEMFSMPRYYVKRSHMRNDRGEGVVRGLREFMRILSSEAFIGPGGVADNVGLNPLDDGTRADVRTGVRRLKAVEYED
jgi:phosphate transport system substrate-binding protein